MDDFNLMVTTASFAYFLQECIEESVDLQDTVAALGKPMTVCGAEISKS